MGCKPASSLLLCAISQELDIADEPSYLQLVPRLVDYVYKALQLKLLIAEEFPEAEK